MTAAGSTDELNALVAELRAHVHQLEQAVQSRDVISTAKGILMATNNVGGDAAFAMLSSASQRENRKLHEIAVQIVHGHEERTAASS